MEQAVDAMPNLSLERLDDIWRAIEATEQAKDTLMEAQKTLDNTLRDAVVHNGMKLRDLCVATGLHPNSVRASIRRAAGKDSREYQQMELDFNALQSGKSRTSLTRAQTRPVPSVCSTQGPSMRL